MNQEHTVHLVEFKLLTDRQFIAYDDIRWAEEHVRRYALPYEKDVRITQVLVEGTKPPYWQDSLWLVRDKSGKIDFASFSRSVATQWSDERFQTHRFPEESTLNTMVPSMEKGWTLYEGVKHRHERGAIHPQALPYRVVPDDDHRLSIQPIMDGGYLFSVFAPTMREAMTMVMDAETPACDCRACMQIRELFCVPAR